MSLEQQLKDRLAQLSPTHLDVVNESSGHGGYFPGKESHFKTVIVSQAFAGVRPVQRHQKVYAAAGDLLARDKIHALAIHAFFREQGSGLATPRQACAQAPKTKEEAMELQLLFNLILMSAAGLAIVAILARALTLFIGTQGSLPNPKARIALVALQHLAITVIAFTGIVSLVIKDFDVQPWFYAKVILFFVLVSSLAKA